MKLRLALAQANSAFGENVYLPLAVGCIAATAYRDPVILDDWLPPTFLYKKEPITKALERVGGNYPDLIAFSSYVWNWEWNRALARAVKEVSPATTVVYGGVHVPDHPTEEWFNQHPECDYLLHGEGETSFPAFLKEYALGPILWDWKKVSGFSARGISTPRSFPPVETLRSPYLDGTFNSILNLEPRWQCLQESDRGCPYGCHFCQWGSSALNKIRQFPMDRVLGEIDWFGYHQSPYIDNANANFGVLERDELIAEVLVKTKDKYNGYPTKFRAAFAKYTNEKIKERIVRISKMLHRSGQLKAVTLALQSTDEQVLINIDRKNISLSGFAELQNRYRADGIPTYTELILGLPGETYESWKRSLDSVIDSGQVTGLFVYLCSVLPNSEMNDPAYREKHGIDSVNMLAHMFHITPDADVPPEYQETVIATKTLPHRDWLRAYYLSWAIQTFHCLGLLRWWAEYEREHHGMTVTGFYERLLEQRPDRDTVFGKVFDHVQNLLLGALEGGSWDDVIPGFGPISWPPDEGAFLRCVSERERFYGELEEFCGMPPEQRLHGPPAVPEGRGEGYGKTLWYGRKGDLTKALREFVSKENDNG